MNIAEKFKRNKEEKPSASEWFNRNVNPNTELPMEYAKKMYSDEVIADLKKSRLWYIGVTLSSLACGFALVFISSKVGNYVLTIIGFGGGLAGSWIAAGIVGEMWKSYRKAYKKSDVAIKHWEEAHGIYFEEDDEPEEIEEIESEEYVDEAEIAEEEEYDENN